MTKKPSAGRKKLEKKVAATSNKTYGDAYPAPNPTARAKGVIVHQGESSLEMNSDGSATHPGTNKPIKKNKPVVTGSDEMGELRYFPVAGGKNKSLKKNINKAEGRAQIFMNETAGKPLKENN